MLSIKSDKSVESDTVEFVSNASNRRRSTTATFECPNMLRRLELIMVIRVEAARWYYDGFGTLRGRKMQFANENLI